MKVKVKEWASGVERDDTYGKCGRKKGKLRGAESAAAERLLG